MAFGLQVFASDGTIRLDTAYRLTRFLYATLASAGAGGSQAVTGLVPANCVGFAVPRDFSPGKAPHVVTLTTGLVTWSTPPRGTSVDSDIYVVQYR